MLIKENNTQTVDVKKSIENETFNRRALQYYCKIKFNNA